MDSPENEEEPVGPDEAGRGLSDGLVEQVRLEWLDTSPLPMAVMDHRRKIHWYNTSAGQIFQTSKTVFLTEGYMTVGSENGSAKLHAFIKDASNRGALSLLTVGSGKDHILLKGRLIARQRDTRLFGVSVQHSRFHAGVAAQHTKFAETFSLTKGEARVAQELALGFSASDVAKSLEISIETVRTHIRRIYGKLGVGSREGLLARVRPYLTLL